SGWFGLHPARNIGRGRSQAPSNADCVAKCIRTSSLNQACKRDFSADFRPEFSHGWHASSESWHEKHLLNLLFHDQFSHSRSVSPLNARQANGYSEGMAAGEHYASIVASGKTATSATFINVAARLSSYRPY